MTDLEVEKKHTSDRMITLEITMDHLEEIPDYYIRLLEMKKEAEQELAKEEKDK